MLTAGIQGARQCSGLSRLHRVKGTGNRLPGRGMETGLAQAPGAIVGRCHQSPLLCPGLGLHPRERCWGGPGHLSTDRWRDDDPRAGSWALAQQEVAQPVVRCPPHHQSTEPCWGFQRHGSGWGGGLEAGFPRDRQSMLLLLPSKPGLCLMMAKRKRWSARV